MFTIAILTNDGKKLFYHVIINATIYKCLLYVLVTKNKKLHGCKYQTRSPGIHIIVLNPSLISAHSVVPQETILGTLLFVDYLQSLQ